MAGDPWAAVGSEVSPQQPQTLPASPANAPLLREVLSVPPDPLATQNTQAGIGEKVANVQNVTHDNAYQDRQARLNFAQTLRTEFNQKPALTAYQTVLQSAAAALKAETTPTGDQQLITAYAKALDPNSVVRESEFDTVSNADSAVGRLWAKIQKEGGIDGAGLLRPEVRDRIKRALLNLADTGAQTYQQQRQFYSDLAKRNNIDPFEVIGPDIAEPFRPTLDAFRKQVEPQGQANAATNKDIYANGLRWGDQPDDGSFDRDAYLREHFGIDSAKEDLIVGFWNANRGNQNLTPEAVKQWYQGQGLDAPTDSDLAKGVAAAHKGVGFAPLDTKAAEDAYHAQLDRVNAQQGVDTKGAGHAVVANAAEGATFNLGDEAAGLEGAAGALVRGENPVGAYHVSRDLIRRELELAHQAHPMLSTVGEVGGGLLTAPLAFSDATTMAHAIRAGATLGAVTGFGSGEGAANSLGQAAIGGAGGAALGAAGHTAGSWLAQRAAARAAASAAAPSEGAEVIGAADRLNSQFGTNIQPIPADVGGPGTRMATGAAATLPFGVSPVVKGAQAVVSEAEKAKNAIAGLVGTSTTAEGAGEAALQGAQKYIKTSKTKVDALYATARRLGGDQPVDLVNARAALDRNIADLSQTPGGAPGLADLQALRAELEQPFPVEGVKRMRTTLNDRFAGTGLRSTDLQRRVGQVVDAADQDITASLSAAGKSEAVKAYTEAAAAHRERLGVIDNVLAPIIGKQGDNPRSVEEILRAIDSASKTRGAKLGQFLGALPKEDAATVRATLISRLGRVSNGRQDAEGTAFSLNDFLTHWNNISGPAKSQLFGGELRAALDDLAKVAQGTKEAQRFENSSKTGAAVGQLATGALLGRAVQHPIQAVAGILTQNSLGRLMASPTFARWLAKMPSNPAAAVAHVQRLSKIASADSVIATDALGLQRQLLQALQAPTKLAADQPNNGTSTRGAGTQ
jgi:hypothetical protein